MEQAAYIARLIELKNRVDEVKEMIKRDGILPGTDFLVEMLEKNIAELEALTKNDKGNRSN